MNITEKEYNLVYRICRRYNINIQDSLDISQTVFEKFLKYKGKILNREAFLTTITKNTCKNFFRSNRYMYEIMESDKVDEGSFNRILAKDFFDKNEKYIKQYKNKYEIYKLRREEYTLSEISNKLDMNLETVSAHWKQTVKMIKND